MRRTCDQLATNHTRKSFCLLVALLAFGSIVAAPAVAQTKPRPDAAERTSEKKQDICLNKAQTTADRRQCHSTHIAFQEQRLARSYDALLSLSPDADQKKALEDAQKAWEAYRSSTCGLYMNFLQGTIWHPVADECFAKLTAERRQFLEELREEFPG
jgi:uncharacterized protein YecT (DUF1311 family)